MAKTFRNKNFVKRDYDCTNVIACVATEAPKSNDGRWVEASDMDLSKLQKLYTQAGVEYYGYL